MENWKNYGVISNNHCIVFLYATNEVQKTNRRLQKAREKLSNDRKNLRPTDYEKGSRLTSVSSDSCLTTTRSQETNDHHSNVHQNGNFFNGNNKIFSDNAVVKRLQNENEILTKKLNIMNEDFIRLENEHIHDLKLLQEIYEHDMASLLKDNIKFEDSKAELQVQINTQVATISHLKQTIEKLQELVIVLKAEKEHLENEVKMLNEKVKYPVTSGTE
ncbi:hypothetical protein PV328_004474 [Microctonus aethiopoides]|uniref:Uncharacterized protein n=1 Tax=Microctonus aethiopoides TaxID=144406 RepID=A0AA39KLN3_9HYME|nr:hypothetical protein PV328_004474 [Microctonus aethiopoides]